MSAPVYESESQVHDSETVHSSSATLGITSQEIQDTFGKIDEEESGAREEDIQLSGNDIPESSGLDALDEGKVSATQASDGDEHTDTMMHIDSNDETPHVPDSAVTGGALTDAAVEEPDDNEDGSTPAKKSRQLFKSQVKKPSGKWILYTAAHRKSIQQEHPSATIGDISRLLKDGYHNMSAEEASRYDAEVLKDKERYALEMAQAIDDPSVPQAAGGDAGANSSMSLGQATAGDGFTSLLSSAQLAFPMSRVKRTTRMDDDVKAMSKDALVHLTKATELFVGYLARKAGYTVSLRGARLVKESDVIQTIYMNENLEFLRLDFPRKIRRPAPNTGSAQAGSKAGTVATSNNNHRTSSSNSSSSSGDVAGGAGKDDFMQDMTKSTPSHRLLPAVLSAGASAATTTTTTAKSLEHDKQNKTAKAQAALREVVPATGAHSIKSFFTNPATTATTEDANASPAATSTAAGNEVDGTDAVEAEQVDDIERSVESHKNDLMESPNTVTLPATADATIADAVEESH